MHIHLPKAPHGLIELAREVGVIVIGILIAIGLEHAAEEYRWHRAVAEAREALREEMTNNNRFFVNRLAAGPCVRRHIADVALLVAQASREHQTHPAANIKVTLGTRVATSQWDAEMASQSIVHFPHEERGLLADYYSQTHDMLPWRDQETELWDQLAVLEGPSRAISDLELATLRSTLKRIERLDYLMTLNINRQLERSRRLGLQQPPVNAKWVAAGCSDISLL